MTVAEIRGKISEMGTNLSERMEDLLTSDIFGCMRYLPPEKALFPFLEMACSFKGNLLTRPANVERVHYSFWPWVECPGCIPCEPDLILGLETEDHNIHLVLVEAKYYADKSSDEDEREEPNDQLARELDNLNSISCSDLKWDPKLNIRSRILLFVTKDMAMPRSSLAQSLAEYGRKRNINDDIFWASWRFLPSILQHSIQKEHIGEHIAVLEDMISLLLRKGLQMFHGIEPVDQYFTLHDFYNICERTYSWPKTSTLPLINYTFEVVK